MSTIPTTANQRPDPQSATPNADAVEQALAAYTPDVDAHRTIHAKPQPGCPWCGTVMGVAEVGARRRKPTVGGMS